MSIVIEEVFVLQIFVGIIQMIVWSVIVSRLKPLMARKLETHVFGCVSISLAGVET